MLKETVRQNREAKASGEAAEQVLAVKRLLEGDGQAVRDQVGKGEDYIVPSEADYEYHKTADGMTKDDVDLLAAAMRQAGWVKRR